MPLASPAADIRRHRAAVGAGMMEYPLAVVNATPAVAAVQSASVVPRMRIVVSVHPPALLVAPCLPHVLPRSSDAG